jgi:lysophospholipase L1-like esterase
MRNLPKRALRHVSAEAFALGSQQASTWSEPVPATARGGAGRGAGGAEPTPQPPPPPPLLLALGDSWFAYWPCGDVIDVLKTRGLVECKSFAWAGCTLAQVLEGRPKNEDLGQMARPRQIDQLMAYLRALAPADRARVGLVAVSAGGNDVAGNDAPIKDRVLAELVAPAGAKGSPLLNDEAVQRIVHGELKRNCARLLGFITQACTEALGAPVPIVLHGYDHPYPDGRRAVRLDWLKSVLTFRGYPTPEAGARVMKALINELNEMQIALLRELKQPHLHHVDLRGCLAARMPGAADDWQNELHPSIPHGFEKVADSFWQQLLEKKVFQPLPAAAAPTAA